MIRVYYLCRSMFQVWKNKNLYNKFAFVSVYLSAYFLLIYRYTKKTRKMSLFHLANHTSNDFTLFPTYQRFRKKNHPIIWKKRCFSLPFSFCFFFFIRFCHWLVIAIHHMERKRRKTNENGYNSFLGKKEETIFHNDREMHISYSPLLC